MGVRVWWCAGEVIGTLGRGRLGCRRDFNREPQRITSWSLEQRRLAGAGPSCFAANADGQALESLRIADWAGARRIQGWTDGAASVCWGHSAVGQSGLSKRNGSRHRQARCLMRWRVVSTGTAVACGQCGATSNWRVAR